MFSGAITALITPFAGGKIDYEKLEELIELQIEGGIDALVPCGCTGEAATLTHEEQKAMMKFVVDKVKGRVKVIPGTGSNSTNEARVLTKAAAAAKADGALVITPYYNKPTPEGQFRHYTDLADQCGIPIVIYNVPGRTGTKMTPETIARLAAHQNIVAVKEACGSVDQISAILSRCDITVLSGDDSLTLPMLAVGAKGAISVISNLVPADARTMIQSFNAGDIENARTIHYKMLPLIQNLFMENNPMCVKNMLRLLGKLNGECRMPLCEVSAATTKSHENALKEYGLL